MSRRRRQPEQGTAAIALRQYDPARLPTAGQTLSVRAKKSGYATATNAAMIGEAAQLLGAGRLRKGETIDPAVGVQVKYRLGDEISKGDELYTLHVNDEKNIGEAENRCFDALAITDEPPAAPELIHRRIEIGE